ncbi:MAG: microcin ABC transporter ATP-binding protein, partial [Bacteroidota bacterium]
EAVSALDTPLRSSILRLLYELSQHDNFGLLSISHDLRMVRQWADRVIIMEDGQIVEQGPTDRVFAAPKAPLTQRLLAGLTPG